MEFTKELIDQVMYKCCDLSIEDSDMIRGLIKLPINKALYITPLIVVHRNKDDYEYHHKGEYIVKYSSLFELIVNRLDIKKSGSIIIPKHKSRN